MAGFADLSEQVWLIEEAPLVACVALGAVALSKGLWGDANAVPPWGTRPTTVQAQRSARRLEGAKPFTDTMLAGLTG